MSDSPGNFQQPPPPPPLPPPQTAKQSKVALKMKAAPADWSYQPAMAPAQIDPLAAQPGIYFFYGSLMDPAWLKSILALGHEPQLRSAYVTGYQCRLWGPYPALSDGPAGAVVEGVAYHVQSKDDADKLANYETGNYRAAPCRISYADAGEPVEDLGFTFMYQGNPRDLTDGVFDMGAWRKIVGR